MEKKILTVSQLTSDIKRLLESRVGEIWVRGEISNVRIPSSGHAYFTLKDENAQISAVMFRGRLAPLKLDLKDGMEVIAFGKVSVYEPQGKYQVMLEFLEPAGLGVLQAAFEQLKERLSKEGLFDPARKRPLPFFPRRIGIVTSSTGAAIRDMLHILARRNPRVSVVLAPVKVQGAGSALEIAKAIDLLNAFSVAASEDQKLDLLIVGRGGGSLEDLWAFNEEPVARAIFTSTLPVISAVGHEIDFTIADFVADMRAPTPSAAAEISVPVLTDLQEHLAELQNELRAAMRFAVDDRRRLLQGFAGRLIRPDRRLADLRLRLDDWGQRLAQTQLLRLRSEKDGLKAWVDLLWRASPQRHVAELKLTLGRLDERHLRAWQQRLWQSRAQLAARSEALSALSPLNILSRGFSVVRDEKTQKILKKIGDFKRGQRIELIVHEGRLSAEVTGISERPETKLSTPSEGGPQGRLWS